MRLAKVSASGASRNEEHLSAKFFELAGERLADAPLIGHDNDAAVRRQFDAGRLAEFECRAQSSEPERGAAALRRFHAADDGRLPLRRQERGAAAGCPDQSAAPPGFMHEIGPAVVDELNRVLQRGEIAQLQRHRRAGYRRQRGWRQTSRPA